MKLLAKTEFLKLPSGTLFSDYAPSFFEGLKIKGDTLFMNLNKNAFDFYYQDLVGNVDCESTEDFIEILDKAEKTGFSFELDFNLEEREGTYNDSDLYAVYEKKDIDNLINALKECKGL
jgi:hypothetical protein